MKHLLPTISILLLSTFAYSQTTHPFSPSQPTSKIDFKALILPATLSFCAGASWGLHEKTMHHWGKFEARFPNANPQWWNPAISWKNKYENGDPTQPRRKIPVQFTDAKHMLASSTQLFGFAAGGSIFIGRKTNWKNYALRFLASGVGYVAGNYLTFNLLYK